VSGTVSVVTASDGSRPDLLQRAAASLARQDLPAGWDVEWLLVLDRTDLVPERLAVEPVVHRTHPRACGVAAARTLAAAEASGSLLYVLDADDALPDGALKALLGGLLAEPRAAWAAGERWDVVDEGGALLEQRTAALPVGTVKPEEVGGFRRLHGRCPFPPAQLLLRRDAVLAAGGWPPLAIEEDTALLLALDAEHCGVVVRGRHLLSRRHAGQGTADVSGLTPAYWTAERWLQARGLA
jgi:glycosyltransferase involved in cell wall biosynthesis